MTKRNPSYRPAMRAAHIAQRLGLPTSSVRQWIEQGTRATVVGRFMEKVDKAPNGCWVWTGYLTKAGYGRAWDGSRVWLAHRLAYTWSVGAIPPGKELDHLCRNTACVNPDHLEPVTGLENMQRWWSATPRATTCRRGHPRTPENTHFGRDPRGYMKRTCYACKREKVAA